ncbi:MAG: DUF721 domain-containing protein [Bacteroidota bacterium]
MSNKQNHQFTIAEALQSLLGDKRMIKGLTESTIKDKWEEMMGKVIAKHTTGMYIKDKTLIVYFNSSIIKNEFTYNKEKAIQIINEALAYDAINDLIIK